MRIFKSLSQTADRARGSSGTRVRAAGLLPPTTLQDRKSPAQTGWPPPAHTVKSHHHNGFRNHPTTWGITRLGSPDGPGWLEGEECVISSCCCPLGLSLAPDSPKQCPNVHGASP